MIDAREFALRDLTPDEMRDAYLADMQYVFPPDELRPWQFIYRDMQENRFLACGLFKGNELIGYVFTACMPGCDVLFGQYVVVKEAWRSQGVGAILMERVAERYAGYRCFLCDVEDPDRATDDADRAQRERRMRFYLRNGFRRTRVKAHVYGVDYEIIVRNLSAQADDRVVFEAANRLYESMAYPGTFPEKYRVRLETLPDRGMRRREFHKILQSDLKFRRVETEEFVGWAGRLRIDRVETPWCVPKTGGAGEDVIADSGYSWLQMTPDSGEWWLTVMYRPDGSLVQYYFDVIRRNYLSDSGEPRFEDWYLDLVMAPDGQWQMLDRDELDRARDNGELSEEDHAEALARAERLMEQIDGQEARWRTLCDRIRRSF